MIELFVEGRKIDIDKGFSTMLTLAIDDIKDFGAKNTTFSKTIVLPGTKSNNINFGNIFNVNAGSTYNPLEKNIAYNFNAAIGASAYIFADNLQIFKGIFRILEIVVDDGSIEYECAVFGELGGFVAKLGNKKLEELDFSAYNHSYTYANITNRAALGTGAGYIYPNNIDYGNYSPAKHDWQYKTMRPAFHVKEYIDKIFAAAGYAYNCALFSTDRFKGFIVPNNQKKLTKVSSTGLDVSGGNQEMYDPSNYLAVFSTLTSLGSYTANGPQNQFTFGGAGNVVGKYVLQCDGISYNPTNSNNTISITTQSSIVQASILTFNLPENTVGEPFSFTMELPQIVAPSDLVDISVGIYDKSIYGGTVFIDSLNLKFIGTSLQVLPINLGEAFNINDTLPKNVLQKDFVSSIVKLFNLYVFEDYDNDKVLKIEPFVDFYANATAIDWSNKIDRSKPIKIKPMSELNSRYFEFNYKDDSDYWNDLYKKRYNQTYGSLKYDSEFEFANEVTKVDLIFAATPLVGYTGEDKVYSTIFKRTGDVTGVGEDNVDSVIRILQTKLITGVTSWAIKDGATTLGSLTNYVYAGHFDDPDAPSNDLNFGVPRELFFDLGSGSININQFNVYWSSYLAEITDKDSRLVTATIKLAYKDIYQLDFSKLIWLDGNLYRINKIEDFNASEPDTCKVELLKIINRIY